MDAETIKTLASLMMQAGQYKPLVDGIKEVVKEYVPDLKDLMQSAAVGLIDIKADCVAHMESRGFSHEEAIMMTCDQWSAIARNMSNNKSNSQSK